MLNLIKEDLVTYANIISSVVGLDVEIVDINLMRIAGTGIYHTESEKNIYEQGEVCKAAIREERSIIVKNPRNDKICLKCKKILSCVEKFSLYTPIFYEKSVIGVIGFVSFDDESREKALGMIDSFVNYVEEIAENMSQKVRSIISAKETKDLLSIMQQIVNCEIYAILVLNSNDEVSFSSSNATKELGVDQDLIGRKCSITPTGISYSSCDEYILKFDNENRNVVGEFIQIACDNEKYAKAILFESFEKYTKRISQNFPHNFKHNGVMTIIGHSNKIQTLRVKAKNISKSTSPILILGESGTGKEILARAIHAESNRSEEPFIAINCGAIPDALLESELFGYVEGAFTGASRKGSIGKFEMAHRGTIFLDEIGSMPLHLQVKILRVLQEFQLVRLGCNQVVDVDIRVIAATNEDLEKLIQEKKFRADLYYRLNVIPFLIPPLRERVEDIEELGNFFLDRYCERFNKKARVIPPRILKDLKKYPWPGNIRELENTMEYISNVISDDGPVLQSHLPPYLKTRTVGFDAPRTENRSQVLPLSVLEQQEIRRAIKLFGNSTEGKKQAAEALGISCSTLYRKLSAD